MDPTWTVCAFCKASGLATGIATDDLSWRPPQQFGAVPPPRGQGATDRTLEQRAMSDPGGFPPKSNAGTAFEGLAPLDAARGASAIRRAAPGTEFDASLSRKTVVQDMPAISFEDAYSSKFKTPEPIVRAPERPESKKTEFGIARAPGGISMGSAPNVSVSGSRPAAGQRKIVAMLVTYTWKPEGECFPVREGRNWIGRNPDNEVPLGCDPTLSGVNSSIVFREGTFMISDKDSMGGTDVNGKTVWPEQVAPLPNYARIRTGSTIWTFLVIEPMPAN